MVRRRSVGRQFVSKLPEQSDEFLEAAVDVADDVERSVLPPAVGPPRLSLDLRRVHFLWRAEDGDSPEAFAFQTPDRATELRSLLADDVRAEVAVGSGGVSFDAELLGNVEDDCHGEDMLGAGQFHEGAASLALDVGGINDSELPCLEALGRDEVQDFEGGLGG